MRMADVFGSSSISDAERHSAFARLLTHLPTHTCVHDKHTRQNSCACALILPPFEIATKSYVVHVIIDINAAANAAKIMFILIKRDSFY